MIRNRKLWGAVARISHNYIDCELLVSEVRVCTRTNDDIGITGLDIRDFDVYTAVDEKEVRGEGVVYKQLSDKRLEGASKCYSSADRYLSSRPRHDRRNIPEGGCRYRLRRKVESGRCPK